VLKENACSRIAASESLPANRCQRIAASELLPSKRIQYDRFPNKLVGVNRFGWTILLSLENEKELGRLLKINHFQSELQVQK
jgi:hypothetical protein